MKTILYNPIFINPQAYYVFPRLTRWLRPDDSYKEPANYIGQIEVTIIAYGEIGYTEYFEHTNYIDFTNFSNSYVRISLFTRLGSCVLGEWKIGTMEGDRPYIEPEVLASLKAVVIVGDKTNQDKDRDIVANLVDASNPFIISNAAFKLNSGFGKYEVDFMDYSIVPNVVNITRTSDKLSATNNDKIGQMIIYKNIADSSKPNTPAFKIKISNLTNSIRYYYIDESDTTRRSSINITSDGIYNLPESKNTLFSGTTSVNIGFGMDSGGYATIEQIPSYQGAFVTDGVNDLITSTKTVQDMLGGSNEITVVSMMANLEETGSLVVNVGGKNYLRNIIASATTNKYGIFGYSSTNINTIGNISVINNILGDKNDYTANYPSSSGVKDVFSVNGFEDTNDNTIKLVRKVAWYWTIIANKVLTTDQINQVIAYYNLDRTVKTDIYCNITKQGITNENHAEFDDKLIDYSGNGRDIQMYNLAWKGGSGIGAKQGETIKDWSKNSR